MGRSARDRRPQQPRPVQRIQLPEGDTTKRMIAVLVLIALGVGFLTYGVSQLVSHSAGWTQIEAKTSSEMNCTSEFVLQYDLGKGETSATVEYKRLSALYTEAATRAYQTYHATELFEGCRNLAYLNRHPNEAVTVEEPLYAALEAVVDSGSRLLFLGPVYEQYDALFGCVYDYEAENFDPLLDADVKAYVDAAAAFAADPDAVSLELLGDGQVRLNVSEKYLCFAEENETAALLDFFWLKNAFIADDLAQALKEAGYTRGVLSSYDGFSRRLGSEEDYSFNIYDRVGEATYPAAVMRCGDADAIVYLRGYARNELDTLHYYTYAAGEVRTPYIALRDGLSHAAVNDLTAYASDQSCRQIALALAEIYLADSLDETALLALRQRGIDTVYCKDRVILHTDPAIVLEQLFQNERIMYTQKTISK